MSGEVSWEEESEVREVIADIRDSNCDLNWVIFGYKSSQIKVISVISAGNGGLEELTDNLDPNQVMFAFLQVEERAFAFIQWCPDGANGASRARASVHKSFVSTFLGNLAVDWQTRNKEELTLDKLNEELRYFHSTSGRQLDASEAERKRVEEANRKKDLAKRQALAGNTHEAQRKLASLLSVSSTTESKIFPKVSGTNVSTKAPPKSLSATLFEQAKVSVELEDEENLKELMLDLREADICGDFNWMILGYAEDKKNTLSLLETGNGGRKGIADYLRSHHEGALDKVLYLLIKEDDTSNKCTFVCWIGPAVPAFFKASASTHRGAISKWMSSVIHNLKEEYCETASDLLGLKEVASPKKPELEQALIDQSRIGEVERKVQNMPYAGKVLNEVKRDKTPQELWMERKAGGLDTPKSAKSLSSSTSWDSSHMDNLNGTVDNEKEFTQIQLKSRSAAVRSSGRSKFAKKIAESPNGVQRAQVELDCDVKQMSRSELHAAAQKASSEAEVLEEEAALKRKAATKLRHAALMADGRSNSAGAVESDDDRRSRKASSDEVGNGACPEESVFGPASASSPEEQPLSLRDDADLPDTSHVELASLTASGQHSARSAASDAVSSLPPCSKSDEHQRMLSPTHDVHSSISTHNISMLDVSSINAEKFVDCDAASSAEKREMKHGCAAGGSPLLKHDSLWSNPFADPSDWKESVESQNQQTSKKPMEKAPSPVKLPEELCKEAPVETIPTVNLDKKHEKHEVDFNHHDRLDCARSTSSSSLAAVRRLATTENKEDSHSTVREAEIGKEVASHSKSEQNTASSNHSTDEKAVLSGELPALLLEPERKAEKLDAPTQSVQSTHPFSPPPKGIETVAAHTKTDESHFEERKKPEEPKRTDEVDLRRKAEDLLARKKALLEEAARSRASAAADRVALGDLGDNGEQDRIKRAEEFRQRKLAELAARRGADSDASSKKAAFLREAEEVVRRAALQEATRKLVAEPDRRSARLEVIGRMNASFTDDDSSSVSTPPDTPPTIP